MESNGQLCSRRTQRRTFFKQGCYHGVGRWFSLFRETLGESVRCIDALLIKKRERLRRRRAPKKAYLARLTGAGPLLKKGVAS